MTNALSNQNVAASSQLVRKYLDQYLQLFMNEEKESDGCAMTVGIIAVIISLILLIWSFSWSWVSHSTRKAFVTYDFHWLQYLFYPSMGLIFLIGMIFILRVSKKR